MPIDIYDLVRIEWRDGLVGFIPARIVEETGCDVQEIPLDPYARGAGDNVFSCIICGEGGETFLHICDECANLDEEAQDAIMAERARKVRHHRDTRKENFLRALRERRELPRSIHRVSYVLGDDPRL